jgi:hypothetical protein
MATSRRPCLWLSALLAAGCASQAQSLRDVRSESLTLTSADGEVVPLEELWRGHAATVLVFWSSECPCVRRYQDRVDESSRSLLIRARAGGWTCQQCRGIL